jgi:predicted house-cleaning NTP pyrophosphatase (Maf/HAM1 superfamily)
MDKEKISRPNGSLDNWLAGFFQVDDPWLLPRLKGELRKSWINWVDAHPYQAAHDLAFEPPPQRREEEALTTVRIITSSPRKRTVLEPVVKAAGFIPVSASPTENEEVIHARVRRNPGVTQYYAMHVAARKLSQEALDVPAISLDTATVADNIPLEKPVSLEGAKRMIARLNGNIVTTTTGLVIGMPFRSGRIAHFLNQVNLTYKLRPIPSTEIVSYVDGLSHILDIAGSIDLTDAQARQRFIDYEYGITFSGVNFLNERGNLTIKGDHIDDPILDSYFAGVPVHSVNAFLPLVNNIYAHADPLMKDSVATS